MERRPDADASRCSTGAARRARVAQARAEQGKAAQDRIALENHIRLEAKESVDRLNVAEQRALVRRAQRDARRSRRST